MEDLLFGSLQAEYGHTPERFGRGVLNRTPDLAELVRNCDARRGCRQNTKRQVFRVFGNLKVDCQFGSILAGNNEARVRSFGGAKAGEG